MHIHLMSSSAGARGQAIRPAFKHSEAFSSQIVTDNQAETDRYWNAIVNNGGTESACGWCKDRWGLSWQITPRTLLDATTDPDRAAAKRDRKSTRLNSSHANISYAVFCLKKKKKKTHN